MSAFDADDIAHIYDEYHPAIYRYIYRQVSDVESARDLTADVFHRLLQAVFKGKGPTHDAKSWLYRTAHNIVIDHYRRNSYRDHIPINENLIAGNGNTANIAENRISAEVVLRAMNKLTPAQRQVISLKFLSGMSNNEVAMIMKKPVGAVKSLQHRAMAAMQRELIPEKEIA